jgi:3-dehydroquinate dehydratase-1
MNKAVKVKQIVLGEGKPKICIPLTEPDIASLRVKLKEVRATAHDLVEFRADRLRFLSDSEIMNQALQTLHEELPEDPILFTIRTSVEMDEIELSSEVYETLCRRALESGLIDLIDIELSRGLPLVEKLVGAAHAAGVKAVISCHLRDVTPETDVMVNCLRTMQAAGADIAKLAVMPRCERDVLRLLDATLTMKEDPDACPVITMAMGPLGALSRISGALTGSVLTFGAVGSTSAPGQLPAAALKKIIDLL